MSSNTEANWHKSLNKKDLLELAFILAQKALPAWNNFHTETTCEIKTLPENALKEIEVVFSGNSNVHTLNKHYTAFITPVIHIRDGRINYPYEVKQAFLSVFHILHGILSSNVFTAKEALSSAITRAIDAIKIAGILTAEEVSLITHKYYLLSKMTP